ncbi:hypothetical protein OSB04_016047 [Centaurea solstitialis]|uniref:PGG domain-containing protein n=1 Tax=Centaurea solstitialis TaxID=347529 RepID=A0AA38W9G4_9ASTR|nr:hypothetical protein OSB04_016047 [Centaurea solstitialis]
MADSSAQGQNLKYLYASNVNVSNFVSEKLSSDDNYPLWKAQMLCLMESHEMRGIVDNLFDDPGATYYKTKKQYDSLLKGWIFGSLTPDVLRAVVHLQSARDVWWQLQFIYDQEKSSAQDVDPTPQRRLNLAAPQDSLQEFAQITKPPITEPEYVETTINKKLQKATVEGRWWEAKSILKIDKHLATEAITPKANTMLHLAVAGRQNDFVKELLDFIDDDEKIEKQNSDGRTALHVAAIDGNMRAVELLVEKRKELLGIPDHRAFVPLLSAYYNMKLDTFEYLLDATNKYQSQSLGFFPAFGLQPRINLLITLIFTKQYVLSFADLAWTWVDTNPELVISDDQVLMAMVKTFPSDLGFWEKLVHPSLNSFCQKLLKRCSLLFHSYEFLYSRAKDILWAQRKYKRAYYSRFIPEMFIILLVPVAVLYPIYQLICVFILALFYLFLVLYFVLWKVFAAVVPPIKRIDNKKKDYMNAKNFLKSVCDRIDRLSSSGSDRPLYTRPVFEALCQGSYEVVEEILVRAPELLGDKFKNGHNITQLAVIYRSAEVYNIICRFIEHMDLSVMDYSMNNLLHLAGRLAPSSVLSRTTGAALQLQRELQWFKGIEKLMWSKDVIEMNADMETPEMVFTREHKDLMKDGEKWMKTTAESCSITAALITTIVFAAAITVPGGSDQETGIPLFKKDAAFTVFAVSDAISLFASSTALLVFLSILTARFSVQDFLVSLPTRLIIGLCALCLSTIAMMVAFGSILFLVFCDQRPWMLAPIGALASLPIAVIVTLQFPLVVDLFTATYHPFLLANCNDTGVDIIDLV